MSPTDLLKSSAALLASAVPLLAGAELPEVQPLAAWPEGSAALVGRTVGRVAPGPGGRGWRHQWPGTYFEARFAGGVVYVDLGGGDVHARVSIDEREVADVIRPAVPVLRIRGLSLGEHVVRVDVVSESQDGARVFGGFAVPDPAGALPARARARAIEFIGDSYTVGYGAASARRECSLDEVWRTTDNSLAFGPKVARRFDADYRVNAISGRGMVRNFANAAGRTLPAAHAYRLPSDTAPMGPADDADWSPQLLVVALGTNDFSTPVGAGEPWADAAGLAAAFEQAYVAFARSLWQRHPAARFILVATDVADGAAARAVRRVRSALVDDGVPVAEVLELGPLALDGCDWHPSRADQDRIALRLAAAVEAMLPAWRQRPD